MRIAPYILAGGQSSRMGRDKAMIVFGGKTMLARAVETLRAIHPLEPIEDRAPVTVIGHRTLLEGADRSVPDNFPGCGPLGGIETALGDLQATGIAEWALFMPVDMPFLPAGLVEALVAEWAAASKAGARVCHLIAGGVPQPLICLVHRELRPFLVKAFEAGEYRVTPVLQSACSALASMSAGALLCSRPVLWQTLFTEEQFSPIDSVWAPSAAQRRTRPLWFANLNTEHDLREAETFLWDQGSMSK